MHLNSGRLLLPLHPVAYWLMGIALLAANPAMAQTVSPAVTTVAPPAPILPTYIGGGIAGVFNSHSATLQVYRGSTVCGEFSGGNSILPDAWLTFEKPLGDSRQSLWMAPRIRVSDMGASLTTRATDNVRGRNPVDSSLVATNRVFELDASLVGIGADLFVRYPLANSFFVFGGPSISYLLRRDADETERITEPQYAVFVPEGSSSRTIASGAIPNANAIQASATLGANVDLRLSKRVYVAPELSITFPITSIRSDAPWHILRIGLGASLKFDVSPEPELAVVRAPEKPEIPPSEITASVHLSGVKDSAGREIEIPNPQLRVEEISRREAYPLLNYIFFDSGSSTIPARYVRLSAQSADTFQFASLSAKSELEAYHEVLNVMGKRLRDTPGSKITVTGYATALPLATRRAQTVKDYLTSVWRIDPARIKTAGGKQPLNASPRDTRQGLEENERVEITSADPTMLDPVSFETIDRTMNPPKLRLRTSIASRYPLTQYSLTLTQGSRELTRFNSAHAVQDWTPTSSQLPSTEEPVYLTLNLKDSLGATEIDRDSARIEQLTVKRKREERVADKIIERYNLITFDFDKSNLDDRSQRIVNDIARQVTSGDRIELRGYTDLVGEAEHNLKLSTDRAAAVKSALLAAIGSDKSSSVSIAASGEGRSDLVDNSLPEGRFLSRTVQVRIERPVQ